MKAKIKETGKWITVGFYDVETHDIYVPNELDFAPDFDWQAFRREAAKDILAGMLSNPEKITIGGDQLKTVGGFVDAAIQFADGLIRKFQEK